MSRRTPAIAAVFALAGAVAACSSPGGTPSTGAAGKGGGGASVDSSAGAGGGARSGGGGGGAVGDAKVEAHADASADGEAGAVAAGTIVPLYTFPTDASWADLVTARKAHPSVRVVAVVNPNSGPGASKNAAFTTGIAKLVAA